MYGILVLKYLTRLRITSTVVKSSHIIFPPPHPRYHAQISKETNKNIKQRNQIFTRLETISELCKIRNLNKQHRISSSHSHQVGRPLPHRHWRRHSHRKSISLQPATSPPRPSIQQRVGIPRLHGRVLGRHPQRIHHYPELYTRPQR